MGLFIFFLEIRNLNDSGASMSVTAIRMTAALSGISCNKACTTVTRLLFQYNDPEVENRFAGFFQPHYKLS